MKKKIILNVAILVIVLSFASILSACFNNDEPQTFTIQYTDEAGLHSISVTSGLAYSIETIPEKNGYEFLGLFDAKIGGTQYIDETGSSLSIFTDNKNLVLFPQFKAKEYTLILDYQGAAVTGSRSITVSYDSIISELPMNLSLEFKEFTGWFTQPNGKGIQIADKYGVLPANNKITETIFDLSATDNTIYLYAGFEGVKYTVTFYFEDSNAPEEMKVEHGTDIKDIVPETRVNGNAVLAWSKIKNDANKEYVFTGKVTGDMILYAAEYAPVIDFDENGGQKVIPVVARAGSSIALPTPLKENYKFIEWQDENGNAYTSTTMPANSITLRAVWQAKLVFDENGGTEVTDISQAAGTNVMLPTPEKEGFIFAGWYTAEKEKYESKKMPATGILLKAGWYREETGTIYIVKGDTYVYVADTSLKMRNKLTIDMSEILSDDFSGKIKIEAFFKYWHEDASLSYQKTLKMNLYKTETVSENTLLLSKSFVSTEEAYNNYSYSVTCHLEGNKIYCATTNPAGTWSNSYAYIKDYYIDLTYPDTTKLYL